MIIVTMSERFVLFTCLILAYQFSSSFQSVIREKRQSDSDSDVTFPEDDILTGGIEIEDRYASQNRPSGNQLDGNNQQGGNWQGNNQQGGNWQGNNQQGGNWQSNGRQPQQGENNWNGNNQQQGGNRPGNNQQQGGNRPGNNQQGNWPGNNQQNGNQQQSNWNGNNQQGGNWNGQQGQGGNNWNGNNQQGGNSNNSNQQQGNGSGTNTTPAPIPDPACMRTCIVTQEYNPVCGTNRQTYSNNSQLTCAEQCGIAVQVLRVGRC